MRAIAATIIAFILVACAPEFDRNTWSAAKGADAIDNPRGAMVDDAERAGLETGASRAFVRELLGEPDDEGSDFDFYELGVTQQWWPPGQDYLIIHYDERNVVTEVRVISDN